MNVESSINLKKFSLQPIEIGHGAFGKVFKVREISTSHIFAAKISKAPITNLNPDDIRNISNEVNIQCKMNHPSVIKFIGFSPTNFANEPYPVIITELMTNGSLSDIINLERAGRAHDFWNNTRKLINIYGIASAMQYLHEHHILHRDLKPGNILMDDYLFPKIGDFGLSKITVHSKESISLTNSKLEVKGTPAYIAPEIWENCSYTPAGDVYAFGIIVCEIMTGTEPYKGCQIAQIIAKVLNGIRPEINSLVPECFRELIERCWSQLPSDRPTFSEIVQMLKDNKEFITDFDADENDFLDYFDFIDNYETTFESKKKIIQRTKTFKKISIREKIQETLPKTSSNVKVQEEQRDDSIKGKKKSKRFSFFKKDKTIFPSKDFELLDKENQALVINAEDDSNQQFIIGENLIKGNNGFPHNSVLGIKYFKQSIKGGNVEAALYYSEMLIKGKVIPQDLQEAKKILKKHLKSSSNANVLYGKIKKKEGDYSKAQKYFQKASKEGNGEAMYEYGKLLYKGEGCPKNEKEANKYFHMSKTNGYDKSDKFLQKTYTSTTKKTKPTENLYNTDNIKDDDNGNKYLLKKLKKVDLFA